MAKDDVKFSLAFVVLAPFYLLWVATKFIADIFQTPKARERRAQKHLEALFEQTKQQTVNPKEFVLLIYNSISHPCPDWYLETFINIVGDIMELEGFDLEIPKPPSVCDSIEGARYKDLLSRIGARDDTSLRKAAKTIASVMDVVLEVLPEQSANLSAPLFAYPNARATIESVVFPFYDSEVSHLFPTLCNRLSRNLHEVSNVPHDAIHSESLKLIRPTDYIGLDPARAYLKGSPLLQILQTRIPIHIPLDTYFEHTHIVGGSGSGKTSYLAQFILDQIRNEEKPALVIVDSQDYLIPQVRRLAEIQDRITYIDPRNPPSINLFEGGATFDIYKYLFGSILDMELTGKQETFFKFVVRLLQEVPEATMDDLVHVTTSLDGFEQYIKQLPTAHQQFFKDDYTMTYRDTRAQVRTRLQGILADETLSQLLSGKQTEIDIESILNTGGILLVDTSKDALGSASGDFGKVFIFLLMKALYGRKNRHPTFLIADEAFEYFSSTIDDMLNQMRKFRCGCVFAHQNLGQASPELRASFASSTSIKLASQLSQSDARAMAGEMHTTPDFITSLPRLHFALYARGVTKSAVSIEVTPGVLDREPQVELERVTRIKQTFPVTEPDDIDKIDEKPSDVW